MLGINDNYDVDTTYAENDKRGLKNKSYVFFEMTPDDHTLTFITWLGNGTARTWRLG